MLLFSYTYIPTYMYAVGFIKILFKSHIHSLFNYFNFVFFSLQKQKISYAGNCTFYLFVCECRHSPSAYGVRRKKQKIKNTIKNTNRLTW